MTSPTPPVPALERVPDEPAVAALSLGHLSDYFDPFLVPFSLDTLRVGGEVWVSRTAAEVDGLFLYLESERFGSIFSRSPSVVDAFSTFHPGASIFSDFPFGRASEVFGIYRAAIGGSAEPHRYSHRVRAAEESDRDGVHALMRSVHGVVDDRWFASLTRERETCFVVEGTDELAGTGWVSVANVHARLHSLSVRPRYRRTHVGTDLWHARVAWAGHAGATEVVTEISDHNGGSRAISEGGGMRRVGEIYRSVKG
ncbi:MAG: GNAT family N-acetyltransferase [Thermoplasmata archaeon]|jgi:GNAT superfamily N-acetyltransferase|nr:GNAT family N-acetyltransferase [Thermoplasmata archaeon]